MMHGQTPTVELKAESTCNTVAVHLPFAGFRSAEPVQRTQLFLGRL